MIRQGEKETWRQGDFGFRKHSDTSIHFVITHDCGLLIMATSIRKISS